MADQTYEVARSWRHLARVAGPTFLLAGVLLLLVTSGEDDSSTMYFGVACLVLGCWVTFQVEFWMPYRVTLGDTAVVLEAGARQVRIPWDHLESVGPSVWDFNRRSLMWRRAHGRRVRTQSAFENAHRMLTEIERRAPHAPVST